MKFHNKIYKKQRHRFAKTFDLQHGNAEGLHSRKLTAFLGPKMMDLGKVTPFKKMAIFGIYVRFLGFTTKSSHMLHVLSGDVEELGAV